MNNSSKLEKDVLILNRFVDDLADYLASDTLFYPTGPRFPELTLGGWFMRQHRLETLRDQLSPDSANRLEQLLVEGNATLRNNVVRSEEKMHLELKSRLRQWNTYVQEAQLEDQSPSWYATAVEARVMLSSLITQLSASPYRLDSDVPSRLDSLDALSRMQWVSGDFVWEKAWQSAYPKADYWYLYGRFSR